MTFPRRTIFILSFVLVILLAATVVALAAFNAPPIADTYTDLNQPSTDVGSASPTQLWVSLSGDPGGNCVVTNISYLKWNLSSIATAIGPSTLTLTRAGATSNPLNYVVSLYQATDDSWTETTTWNTAPALGTIIESKSFPAANGNTVVFNSNALVTYLEQSTGDDIASFGVRLTSPGSCSGSESLVFNSSEATTGVPVLDIQDPTAVTVTSLKAASDEPAANWPLIGGMAVLALALIGLLGYRRLAR